MAFVTRGLTDEDVRAGILPTTLTGTGVRVLIGGQPANLLYVSPNQINLLVPSNLIAGRFKLRVAINGRAGPEIPVVLEESVPQIFVWEGQQAAATALDWTTLTVDNPAWTGQVVTVFATGLGRTVPDLPANQLAPGPAEIARIADFRVYADGIALSPKDVLYAGLTPGFAGLYQVSFVLSFCSSDRVEIRLGFEEPKSLPGVWVPCRGL